MNLNAGLKQLSPDQRSTQRLDTTKPMLIPTPDDQTAGRQSSWAFKTMSVTMNCTEARVGRLLMIENLISRAR